MAVLVLLRLRRTAALAAMAFFIWMAYSSSDGVNWSYIDAPSMLESTSGWVGPWRITVTILPFAMLACVALAATLHAIRRTPAHGQEA